ncbi:CRISPR-associated helicase Cas3' [Streptomyces parvus]|uniref:CRISPR-associated helicase Cas3' n=1 Tax=Streptomyces parvus TaxID=66428 RepID=UPI0036337C28
MGCQWRPLRSGAFRPSAGSVVDLQQLSAHHEPPAVRALETLWGKSQERAGGTTNLLMAHLLDTAAVAELLWDGLLAGSTRSALEEIAGGPGLGRRMFAWLCGLHDCGKATPVHQRLWPEGADAVRRSGLTWVETAAVAGVKKQKRWRHDWAGGLIVRELLASAHWDPEQVDWVWPLVAGHHGAFPSLRDVQEPKPAKGQLRGTGPWRQVQQAVLDVFTAELGFENLGDVQPTVVPSRALQLQLSGLVVMADWIASDERFFTGLDDLRRVSLEASRVRAASAWQALGLQRGWGSLELPGPEAFRDRFGYAPRPSQGMVVDAAHTMGGPGLMVIEAPMGEGKTEAAQAATEVLAARFGADGVFVGMPTQATSDPMFTRTRRWVGSIDPDSASRVVLLHGKRAFNHEWKTLLENAGKSLDEAFHGVDEFGMDDDPYGVGAEVCGEQERNAPAEWFLGPKRGLLAPFVVGTVDQLLYAATRTRHVMLRMAGLAGKIVVLDEIHACDVYMSQFLAEALRWLGQAGVPVVVLSATLAPAQRQTLFDAYLAGAASREEYRAEIPAPRGYPRVTTAWLPTSGSARFHGDATSSWREDLEVAVRVVPEKVPGARCTREERERLQVEADSGVGDLLASELAAGGTALVIRNSVARAQSLYGELRERFPDDEVRLLHARFTVSRRADLTEESLRLLGPDAPRSRGRRLILVATQLAEQSFDVDADLLITDLAPVDLLLQRMGRLHRHEKTWRPDRLRAPQVFVTGFEPRAGREPAFTSAGEMIYGRHLLLRTAAVLPGAGEKWSVPVDVPTLVEKVYDADVPLLHESWQPAGDVAGCEQSDRDRARAEEARQFLLSPQGDHERRTLAGLHYGGSSAGSDEGSLQAAVRDGDQSVEVVLVVRDGEDSVYRTLAGRNLSVNGDVSADVLDEVLGSAVRLPPKYTESALKLSPLPGWYGHPWLRRSRALVMDASRTARLAEFTVSYDDEFGLRQIKTPTGAGIR